MGLFEAIPIKCKKHVLKIKYSGHFNFPYLSCFVFRRGALILQMNVNINIRHFFTSLFRKFWYFGQLLYCMWPVTILQFLEFLSVKMSNVARCWELKLITATQVYLICGMFSNA